MCKFVLVLFNDSHFQILHKEDYDDISIETAYLIDITLEYVGVFSHLRTDPFENSKRQEIRISLTRVCGDLVLPMHPLIHLLLPYLYRKCYLAAFS